MTPSGPGALLPDTAEPAWRQGRGGEGWGRSPGSRERSRGSPCGDQKPWTKTNVQPPWLEAVIVPKKGRTRVVEASCPSEPVLRTLSNPWLSASAAPGSGRQVPCSGPHSLPLLPHTLCSHRPRTSLQVKKPCLSSVDENGDGASVYPAIRSLSAAL